MNKACLSAKNKREPSFNELLKVLKLEIPSRATLFEFFMNWPLYDKLSDLDKSRISSEGSYIDTHINAFYSAGYDYVTIIGSDFFFPKKEVEVSYTLSLNDGVMITDRKSFEDYPWPDPNTSDYSEIDRYAAKLPEGMKLIIWGPGGVLENVISLVGYENLCFMLQDDPELAADIFDSVGSRFVDYYRICAAYDMAGALISNDDWGFKTQTMLSPEDMRKYVFPWHRRIVEEIHKAGKPAILHSCGNLEDVFEEIICDMKYDAKHSFEDNIISVEDAYRKWGGRIAILGGIDMDFLCGSTPDVIIDRSRKMLEAAALKGGYALGSGNSIPEFVPYENYMAMISVI